MADISSGCAASGGRCRHAAVPHFSGSLLPDLAPAHQVGRAAATTKRDARPEGRASRLPATRLDRALAIAAAILCGKLIVRWGGCYCKPRDAGFAFFPDRNRPWSNMRCRRAAWRRLVAGTLLISQRSTATAGERLSEKPGYGGALERRCRRGREVVDTITGCFPCCWLKHCSCEASTFALAE